MHDVARCPMCLATFVLFFFPPKKKSSGEEPKNGRQDTHKIALKEKSKREDLKESASRQYDV